MYSFRLNKIASSNDKSKISVDESFEKPPKATLSKETKQSSKYQKKWNDIEVNELINLLKKRNCSCDIFHKDHKIQEKTFSTILISILITLKLK